MRASFLAMGVTCLCVLNVCNHGGLVEEAQIGFESMSAKYGVNPSLESYTYIWLTFLGGGHLERVAALRL